MKRLWVILFVIPIFAQNSGFEHLVVFGDSHSDNGFDDGHGFESYSNGKVWPEYLADSLRVKTLDVRAWGGAFSGMGNEGSNAKDWSGLLWQVQEYNSYIELNKTLVIVEIGFNDLHDPVYKISPTQVVDNIINALKILSSKGIKHVIVWNVNINPMPPAFTYNKYPSYKYYNKEIKFAKKQFEEFNSLIRSAVIRFNADQKNTKTYLWDAEKEITEIAENFEDTITIYKNSKFYPKKGKWFWFDEWHFMTETHHYVANRIFQFINARISTQNK
jgi:lysophospholipase L1-like esterase